MTTARTWWKAYYRLQRIALREADKGLTDLMAYGTCIMHHGDDGTVKHIPLSNVFKSEGQNDA